MSYKDDFENITDGMDGLLKCVNVQHKAFADRHFCNDTLLLLRAKADSERMLDLCASMLEANIYTDISVKHFCEWSDNNPELFLNPKNKDTVRKIINMTIEKVSEHSSLVRLRDSLEIQYALGNHEYTGEIIRLYKKTSRDIRSSQDTIEAMQAKIAILAYSASDFTAKKTSRELGQIYKHISDSRLKHLKGMLYYYITVFYDRTGFMDNVINFRHDKNNTKNYNCRETCLKKSQERDFWLTKYYNKLKA